MKKIITILSIISIFLLISLLCISNCLNSFIGINGANENVQTYELNGVFYIHNTEKNAISVDSFIWYLYTALRVATGILWILAIFGSFYLLKTIAFPFLVNFFNKLICFLGDRKRKEKIFKICLAIFLFEIMLGLATQVYATANFGISNVDKDNGHYIQNGVCYIVNDNGETVIADFYAYHFYFYFIRLAFFILSLPAIICALYLFINYFVPFLLSIKRF